MKKSPVVINHEIQKEYNFIGLLSLSAQYYSAAMHLNQTSPFKYYRCIYEHLFAMSIETLIKYQHAKMHGDIKNTHNTNLLMEELKVQLTEKERNYLFYCQNAVVNGKYENLGIDLEKNKKPAKKNNKPPLVEYNSDGSSKTHEAYSAINFEELLKKLLTLFDISWQEFTSSLPKVIYQKVTRTEVAPAPPQ